MTQVFSEEGTKLDTPFAQGLVTDLDTALAQQFLDVTVTHWEAVIQPDGVLNNGHRETVTIGFQVGHGESAYTNPIKATQPRLLSYTDAQLAVIVTLGADSGLRNNEMTTRRRADIHLQDADPYVVVTGKRQKRQEVRLSGRGERVLWAWLATTPSFGPFVLSVRTTRNVETMLR